MVMVLFVNCAFERNGLILFQLFYCVSVFALFIFSFPFLEEQPAHAISEESSSDAARYASKDPIKGRDVCNPDVEVMGRAQLDADKCILERRRGLLHVQPVMTPTHFQV